MTTPTSIVYSAAIADGHTDNSATIERELANLGNGTLILPDGVCAISRPIVLNGAGSVTLSGGKSTSLIPLGHMDEMILINSGFSTVENILLQNVASLAEVGIKTDKPADNLPVSLHDNTFVAFGKSISISGDDYSVANNFFLNNGVSVELGNFAINGRLTSNYILGGSGIHLIGGTQQPEGVSITSNIILPAKADAYGIKIDSGMSINISTNTIDQIISGSGIILDASAKSVAYVTLISNFVGANSNSTSGANGIYINGNVTNTSVIGNTTVGWYGSDLFADGANKLYENGNNFSSTTAKSNVYLNNVANSTVIGNFLESKLESLHETGSTASLIIGNTFATSAYLASASTSAINRGVPLPTEASVSSASLQAITAIQAAQAPVPTSLANTSDFNASYYLSTYQDVKNAGVDPYQHYLNYGAREGRNPSQLFDTNYYLTRNPDVKAAGANPLLHYEQYGWKEGRQPSLMFNTNEYHSKYTDSKTFGGDALNYYMNYGREFGELPAAPNFPNAPDPLVDKSTYFAQLGFTLIPSGVDGDRIATADFHGGGWQSYASPNKLFDTAFYLNNNPAVFASHVDPLIDYETVGWRAGHDPSASFSVQKYLAAYPDVAAAGCEPLAHYLTYGIHEGRTTFATAS